jgi:hypothetical protein
MGWCKVLLDKAYEREEAALADAAELRVALLEANQVKEHLRNEAQVLRDLVLATHKCAKVLAAHGATENQQLRLKLQQRTAALERLEAYLTELKSRVGILERKLPACENVEGQRIEGSLLEKLLARAKKAEAERDRALDEATFLRGWVAHIAKTLRERG